MQGQPKSPISPKALHEDAPNCHSLPLVGTQRRLWTLIAKRGMRSRRLAYVARRLVGPLQVDLLEESLNSLVARHEALRTRIFLDGDAPRQLIGGAGRCVLDVVNLFDTPAATRDRELRRICAEFLEEEVDPTIGPLFAARLFKLSAFESVLVLALEHLITDRTSNEILHSELWTSYEQAAKGLPCALPEPTSQFSEYVFWQQKIYENWRSNHEAHWKDRLASAPRTSIPRDQGVSELNTAQPVFATFSFGTELTDKLRNLSWKEKTLLPVVVFSIYALTLSRWCKQDDLLITFICHARRRAELHGLVGFVANCPRLRVKIFRGSDTFVDLVRRVHAELRLAFDHQDFDWTYRLMPDVFTDVIFDWMPASASPLMQTRSIQNAAGESLTIEPLKLDVHWFHPILIFFQEHATEVIVNVTYQPNAFLPSTIQQFGRNLLALADEVAGATVGYTVR